MEKKRKEGGRQIDKKGEQEKSNDGLQEKKLSPCNIILYAAVLYVPRPVLLLWTVVKGRSRV